MAQSPHRGASAKRILVADDEPHIRRVLETLLETSGFEVESVRDGAEALNRLTDPDRGYHLVLTDLMMPGRSGLDVLAGMRDLDHRVATPVIVLTAKGQDADRERAEALGAVAFLTKPFSPKKLLARIVEILDADD